MMVVYKSLIANLSSTCLDALGLGGDSEIEKLVTVQLKLEKDYPDVIVTNSIVDDTEEIQIKGCWNDIKDIHVLLEKLVGTTPKVQEEVSVKSEPKTEQTDEEDIYECTEETVKETSDDEVPVAPRPLKQARFPRRKVTRPRKSVRVKEEQFLSSDEENINDEDIIGELYSSDITGEHKEVESANYECDTDLMSDGENDEESKDKTDNWAPGKLRKRSSKPRKRRYATDPRDRIEPEDVDEAVKKCVEKSKLDSTSRKDISCQLCDYKSSQSRLLRTHIIRCHSVHKKKCKICLATFGLNKDLASHMKNHAPKIHCTKCKCKFVRQSALDKHMEQCHSNKTKKKEPMEQKKEERPAFYKCDQCSYITEVRRYLRHHVLRNHSERQHKCEVCNKMFGLEKDLRQHMKNHTDANCMQCEECGKTLRSKFALRLHIDSIHRGIKNVYKKEYVCDHCGKVCPNKTVYNDHINKDHLYIKQFGCPLCPMSFFTKYNLRHHLVTHSSAKNYSCETCGKDFKRRSSLRIHQRIHEPVRNFTCDTCKKSFHQQGALKRHERIHTGEKPYKCSICQAAFTDYSILRRHLMGIHKQDKAVSREYLRKKKLEGINRGGEKKDMVTVDDISKYKGVFRGVEEYVHVPDPLEQSNETTQTHIEDSQPKKSSSPPAPAPELSNDVYQERINPVEANANHSSANGHVASAVDYRRMTTESDNSSSAPSSMVPLAMQNASASHSSHLEPRSNVPGTPEEENREIHAHQFGFPSLPLPDMLNPMCLSSSQFPHPQRPDFYASALLQAAQQQQQQHQQHHHHKAYDGPPPLAPDSYYYHQNHHL